MRVRGATHRHRHARVAQLLERSRGVRLQLHRLDLVQLDAAHLGPDALLPHACLEHLGTQRDERRARVSHHPPPLVLRAATDSGRTCTVRPRTQSGMMRTLAGALNCSTPEYVAMAIPSTGTISNVRVVVLQAAVHTRKTRQCQCGSHQKAPGGGASPHALLTVEARHLAVRDVRQNDFVPLLELLPRKVDAVQVLPSESAGVAHQRLPRHTHPPPPHGLTR